ncbi:MAG TPA: hypothetical protein PLK06_03050 [bacterium]|jgi:regulator of replication initiation timing|nr:hypothetical protein [Patescibacteria group bacterium]HRH32279.1 hypothetical protein [bacterium]
MAKSSKGAKRGVSEAAMWTITILTLAVSCAALATLISENQALRMENDQLIVAAE